MDYDASQYDQKVKDSLKPGQDLIEIIDKHLIKLNNPKNLVILDLGCGPGNTTQMLSEHYHGSIETILGVDIDPDMILYAQKKQIDRSKFFVQDIGKPWLEWLKEIRQQYENKIDIIFSNYTLHWIDDTDSLAVAIGHLLKQTGIFVGNLLYCGNLHQVIETESERSLLNRYLNYPTEKEFVSNLIWSLREPGDFHWIQTEYQEPISRFPRKFYEESFIDIPIKWYRKFLKSSSSVANNNNNNIDDKCLTKEEDEKLNQLIKCLILKQRICQIIPAISSSSSSADANAEEEEQIDIKQQLWIIQATKTKI